MRATKPKRKRRRGMSVHTAAAHIIVNNHIEEAMRREQNRPAFGQWYIPPDVRITSGAICVGKDE